MVRRTGAALAALALTPAGAQAASLSVAIDDPVEMVPAIVTVTYDTGGEDLNLAITYRDASGPACAPNASDEFALAGPDREGTSQDKPSTAKGSGTLTYKQTWWKPGARRICGYLTKATSSPNGETRAVAALDVVVREGRGTIAFTTSLAGIRANGFLLVARATGTSETPRSVGGVVVPVSRPCPPRFERPEGSTLLTGPYGTRVGPLTGAFDEKLSSQRPLAFGRWRACMYLETDDRPPTAKAEQIVDPKVSPRNLGRPKVRFRSSRNLTSRYRCDPGAWAAWPKPTFRYAWRVGGRTVSRRRTIDARSGSVITCRVTAVNALGSASVSSARERARRPGRDVSP